MADPAQLRELAHRVEQMEGASSRRPGRGAVPTGVEGLDALLPRGGLPRGESTEWLGPRSCGKTAVLRTALARLRSVGEPVALVDARRTLYAPDWTPLEGEDGRLWVVRPPSESEAAWCADLLLRSGAFGGVALLLAEGGSRGEPALGRGTAVRLQRLAEDAAAVLVVVGELPVATLRLRFRPGRVKPVGGDAFGPFLPSLRPVWVGLGGGREAEVPVLCPPPPDRTPVSRARDRKGRR